MKKTLLPLFAFLIFISLTEKSFSQSFGVGYRVGSGTFKPLDFVIKRYNETRPQLTKQMDKPSSVSGLVYSFGYNLGEFGFDVEIPNLKSNVVTAETPTQTRDLYLKLTGFEINFSYGSQVFNDGPLFGFLGGSLSVDKSDNSVFTRVYNKGASAPDYSEVKADGTVNMGIGPYGAVHLMFPSFILFAEVRPMYKFSITEADFFEVNRALNPVTWSGDELDDQKGSMNYFGVNMKVGLTVDLF